MTTEYDPKSAYPSDPEKGSVEVATRGDGIDLGGEAPLQRQLKSRHVQMISIVRAILCLLAYSHSFRRFSFPFDPAPSFFTTRLVVLIVRG